MGNYWKGISDDELIRAEVNLLKRGGLKDLDFTIHDTVLDDIDRLELQTTDNYIHWVEILNHEIP